MEHEHELRLLKDDYNVLQLPCKLGQKVLDFCIDTGARNTHVSLQTVIDCGLRDKIKPYPPHLQWPDGVVGILKEELVCEDNVRINTIILVRDKISNLLGLDVLNNYRCSIRLSAS